jgi:hypothetical protein
VTGLATSLIHEETGNKASNASNDQRYRDNRHPVHVKSLSEGADLERAVLELKHGRRLTRILRQQLREILPPDITPDSTHGVIARLHAAEKPLYDALYAMLLEGSLLGAQHGREQVEKMQGTSNNP